MAWRDPGSLADLGSPKQPFNKLDCFIQLRNAEARLRTVRIIVDSPVSRVLCAQQVESGQVGRCGFSGAWQW